MKRIITIVFLNLAIVFAFFLTACIDKDEPYIGNATKLVASENGRLGDSISTTNEITFKCSTNYQIGTDTEGNFVLCIKEEKLSFKTAVISCDKMVKETDYYSNKNQLIYKNKKVDNEWIKIDPEYCNTYCSYVIIYVEENNELFYAKFFRK